MSLSNKRVLITAGPTWVPIDSVRVISNIATGETGILLAEKLQRQGAKVTLLLGAVEAWFLNEKIRLIRFKFFDELKRTLIKELTSTKYDILIHSAAVTDYKPERVYRKKIKSGIRSWKLKLVPTAKIIDLLKRINRTLFVVGFKFESQTSKSTLIKKTKKLMQHANLDLAVANTSYKNRYCAYIVNNKQTYGPMFNKKDMSDKLIRLIIGTRRESNRAPV